MVGLAIVTLKWSEVFFFFLVLFSDFFLSCFFMRFSFTGYFKSASNSESFIDSEYWWVTSFFLRQLFYVIWVYFFTILAFFSYFFLRSSDERGNFFSRMNEAPFVFP